MNANRLHRLRVKNIDLTSCDLNDDLRTNISGWNAVAMSTVRSKSNTVNFICDEPLPLSELEQQVWQRLHNCRLFRNEAISPTAKQTATSKRPAVDATETLQSISLRFPMQGNRFRQKQYPNSSKSCTCEYVHSYVVLSLVTQISKFECQIRL